MIDKIKPYYQRDGQTIYLGNSLEILKEIPEDSVDAIITDPPAGIGFMGQEWDTFTKRVAKPKKEKNKHPAFKKRSYDWAGNPYSKQARENFITWLQKIAEECLRVLKPGGHALVWALPRTSHWTATAWENAGFEVRDRIIYATSKQELLNQFLETLNEDQQKLFWILMDESRVEHCFGSGFPKNLNIANQIAKRDGAKRDGAKRRGAGTRGNTFQLNRNYQEYTLTERAKQWEGWGTALKPAIEDWWLLRKPLSEKTVVENVLKWGTGGINIDKSKVGNEFLPTKKRGKSVSTSFMSGGITIEHFGRFPANLIWSHHPECSDKECHPNCPSWHFPDKKYRFFKSFRPILYVSKASRKERNMGLEKQLNNHPTVKPVALMEYLIKLICPPNGIILDPFMGSGTTLVAAARLGRKCIGIEINEKYCEIAKQRIEAELKQNKLL